MPLGDEKSVTFLKIRGEQLLVHYAVTGDRFKAMTSLIGSDCMALYHEIGLDNLQLEAIDFNLRVSIFFIFLCRPGVILGVTNPFFVKTLQHWPHVVRIGEMQEG